jgi:hypothetical protein
MLLKPRQVDADLDEVGRQGDRQGSVHAFHCRG